MAGRIESWFKKRGAAPAEDLPRLISDPDFHDGLHDAMLVSVDIRWATSDEDAVAVVAFKPSFLLAGATVTAHLVGFTSVVAPREFPWGPSLEVLETDVFKVDSGIELNVRSQSGDEIVIRAASIAWYQNSEPDPEKVAGWVEHFQRLEEEAGPQAISDEVREFVAQRDLPEVPKGWGELNPMSRHDLFETLWEQEFSTEPYTVERIAALKDLGWATLAQSMSSKEGCTTVGHILDRLGMSTEDAQAIAWTYLGTVYSEWPHNLLRFVTCQLRGDFD